LEINVAQHWDILAKDLQLDKIDLLDLKLFNGALNHYYRNVHPKMVARNKLRLFLIEGMWKIMPMNFNICAPAKLRFLSSLLMILWGLKEDVQNKVMVDPKGDGGPWEDIKHLITMQSPLMPNHERDR
jgi:hypothetical protein